MAREKNVHGGFTEAADGLTHQASISVACFVVESFICFVVVQIRPLSTQLCNAWYGHMTSSYNDLQHVLHGALCALEVRRDARHGGNSGGRRRKAVCAADQRSGQADGCRDARRRQVDFGNAERAAARCAQLGGSGFGDGAGRRRHLGARPVPLGTARAFTLTLTLTITVTLGKGAVGIDARGGSRCGA